MEPSPHNDGIKQFRITKSVKLLPKIIGISKIVYLSSYLGTKYLFLIKIGTNKQTLSNRYFFIYPSCDITVENRSKNPFSSSHLVYKVSHSTPYSPAF